jgi:protein DJ-1
LVLIAAGIKERRVTSHPSVQDRLVDTVYEEARVVVDGNIVTSRGPGTTFEFALALVELLLGTSVMHQVAKPMLVLA